MALEGMVVVPDISPLALAFRVTSVPVPEVDWAWVLVQAKNTNRKPAKTETKFFIVIRLDIGNRFLLYRINKENVAFQGSYSGKEKL